MLALTGDQIFTRQLVNVSSLNPPSPNSESKRVTFLLLRVLDIGCISCPKDSRRFLVDVDLGLFKLDCLCSRLSRTGRFCSGGGMARSVDIWTRIARPPPVPYPGLQNAGVRITPRTLTLLQVLMFSLIVIQLFISLR